MKKRPKILITGSENGGRLSKWCLTLLIRILGGSPKLIHPRSFSLSERFDGLVVSGGKDIHPHRYGHSVQIKTLYDEERDEFEWQVIERAVKEGKPILGICRGMQLLNVFFGGTLYQEVGDVFDDFLPNRSTIGKVFARHTVFIGKRSRLFDIYRAPSKRVNSLHHQAVNQLGSGLKVTAYLKNGMTQAVERKGVSWIVGVQWHPELMVLNASQRALFSAFIEECQLSKGVNRR